MTAPNQTDIDAMLTAMLAPPTGAGDRGFAVQVERAIDAQAAYARARARFWRSFGFEALAVGALLAALWLLSSASIFASLAASTHWGLAPPLLLILLLWFATQRWRSA
jgi:fatty acid desaturase